MTTTITLVRNEMGDDEMHIGGCGDIARKSSRHAARAGEKHETNYTADTLLEAIVVADQDMAAWFCEEAYSESSRENGCWSTTLVKWGPCFAKAVKAAKITFENTTGRPVQGRLVEALAPEAAADFLPICRKCKTNPVGKVNWTWCRDCVTANRAAKKAAKSAAAAVVVPAVDADTTCVCGEDLDYHTSTPSGLLCPDGINEFFSKAEADAERRGDRNN